MASVAKPKKTLHVFSLAMMNVAVIASLRVLPMMAKEGFSLVFFFAAAALMFLIPSALVSAELATGWPKAGGVYVWVKEGLGDKLGFLAIWLEWIQNVIWYPTVLSFTGATLAYVWDPHLASNKFYMISIILGVYWFATIVDFFGLKTSKWVSTLGVVIGTIFPTSLIIILGAYWYFSGHPLQIDLSWRSAFPDFEDLRSLVFLAGVLLTFAGMEVSAVHAQEVENPERDYPRAILLSVIIVLGIFSLGSLAIAFVVPHGHISLVAGLMQAFTDFFDAFNLRWIIPVMAILACVGTLAEVATWIVGPSKGLLVAGRNGELPLFLQRTNRHGVPIWILIIQGLIVTALSVVFLLMPTVSSSYWILTALTAQVYLIMYILMYIAAIRLRYTQPKVKRAYRVPGGNVGMWFVGLVGILGSAFAIFIGFFPPQSMHTGNIWFYEIFLASGILIFCSIPFIISACKRTSWTTKKIA